MDNQDDKSEMLKLRTKVYGCQAREFLEMIEESLLLKGWNIPSIGYDYVKAFMIGRLFTNLPKRFQEALYRQIGNYLSSKKQSESPQHSEPIIKDDYPERLWRNGFAPQITQKHLF